MSEQIIKEQIDYYRARAGEYDEWFLRQGRYDHGEKFNERWFAQAAQVRAALTAFAPRGDVSHNQLHVLFLPIFIAYGLAFLIVSGPFTLAMPGYWVDPDWTAIAYVTACGLIAGTAHFLLIQGYRLGEAAVVAPFEYSTLLWAVLFGFVIWSDVPSWSTLAGVLLVAASGLYVLRTERR